jgi:hypothetical protein
MVTHARADKMKLHGRTGRIPAGWAAQVQPGLLKLQAASRIKEDI